MGDWKVETIRVTGFTRIPEEIEEKQWWQDVCGTEPQARIEERGQVTTWGPVPNGEAVLGLIVHSPRVDWKMGPAEPGEADDVIATLRELPAVLREFTPIVKKWLALPTCPLLSRLAFGAVLLQPVSTLEDGYVKLSSYLHEVKLDAEQSSDFLYQINRPRASTTEGLSLNLHRLSTWSVALRARFHLTIGSQEINYEIGQGKYACRLALDLSTPADLKEDLSVAQLPALLDEFIDLAQEISTKGDIP